MEYLLTSKEMKACDTGTIEGFGVPSEVLMERAALSVAEEIVSLTRKKSMKRFLVVCGTGNNGGDGIAIARLLFLKGYQAEILFPGAPERATSQTKLQYQIAQNYGIPIYTRCPENDYDGIVDALFGIGLSRNLEGEYAACIRWMNERKGIKIAVDIPSGICADTGAVMGEAFRADLTVTFGFAKIGQMLYPGASYTGRLLVKEIGIDEHGFLGMQPAVRALTGTDLIHLPERRPDGNKGTFGRILVMAGSVDMAGAAVFSAKACYASGAGLVKVFTPKENRTILQTLVPEAILETYDRSGDGAEKIQDGMSWADVIVLGPGISTDSFAAQMTELVLKEADVPCIVDADALNLIAQHKEWLRLSKAPLILTPHLGEMARLTGKPVSQLKENLIQEALDFATEFCVCTVMKDARTVIALPDGSIYVNRSGNSGLATAGAGDVLTGVVAALAAQGMSLEQAAVFGVYVHGLAGDLMAGELGTYGLTAEALIRGIPKILKEGKTDETI